MSIFLNGNEYQASDFIGAQGRGYQDINPDTDLPFFPDSIFTDMLAEIDSSLTAYDVSAFIIGTPSGQDIVFRFVAVRPVTFADDFFGSEGLTKVTSTGTRVMDIQKNGIIIGTLTFTNAGGVDGVFATSAGETILDVGDVLDILAPLAADATLRDVCITLKG